MYFPLTNVSLLRISDGSVESVAESRPTILIGADFSNTSFLTDTVKITRVMSWGELVLSTFGGSNGFIDYITQPGGVYIVAEESDYLLGLAWFNNLIRLAVGATYGQELQALRYLYQTDLMCKGAAYPFEYLSDKADMVTFMTTEVDASKVKDLIEIDYAVHYRSVLTDDVLNALPSIQAFKKEPVKWILNAVIGPMSPARWVDEDAFLDLFHENGMEDKVDAVINRKFDLDWPGMEGLSISLLTALDALQSNFDKHLESLKDAWRLYHGEIEFTEWMELQGPFLKKLIGAFENKHNLYLFPVKVLST